MGFDLKWPRIKKNRFWVSIRFGCIMYIIYSESSMNKLCSILPYWWVLKGYTTSRKNKKKVC